MTRYRGFQIIFKPCTDIKPSRLLIKDLKRGDRKALSSDYESIDKQAIQYLESRGIEICGQVVMDSTILLTENFDIKLK